MGFRQMVFANKKTAGELEVLQPELNFHLEAGNAESFNFSTSTIWLDLIGGIPVNFIPSLSVSWGKIQEEKALQNSGNTSYLQLDPSYQIAAGEDFTFGVYGRFGSGSGGNPGFFRDGTNIFVIQNGQTRRPWIRLGGTDIFKPTTGFQWTDDVSKYTYMTIAIGSHSVERPGFYSICFNGVEQYSGNHTKVVPASSIPKLLHQVSSEHMTGIWRSFQFYRKALTPSESLYNNQKLIELYT